MNVKKCENGHFYDADKYLSCPHCSGNGGAHKEEDVVIDLSENDTTIQYTPPQPVMNATQAVNTGMKKCTSCGRDIAIAAKFCKYCGASVKVDEPHIKKCPVCGKVLANASAKFCKFCGASISNDSPVSVDNPVHPVRPEPAPVAPMAGQARQEPTPAASPVSPFPKQYRRKCDNILAAEEEVGHICGAPVGDQPAAKTDYTSGTADNEEYVNPSEIVDVSYSDTPEASLEAEVEKAVRGSDGETVSVFVAPGHENKLAKDPVVGWIVCISGMHKGESFELFTGQNSIGRDNSNRIVISGDIHVSNEKHAWIIYEPKKREFFVKSGEGSGLTYINGECIMGNQKIEKGDVISIGDGGYMFIPLCNESFSWEEYIK